MEFRTNFRQNKAGIILFGKRKIVTIISTQAVKQIFPLADLAGYILEDNQVGSRRIKIIFSIFCILSN